MIPTDEIISMAKQCGLPLTYVPHDDTFSLHVDGLVAFANLVSAHEREACAKVCDKASEAGSNMAYMIAKAIRARGESA